MAPKSERSAGTRSASPHPPPTPPNISDVFLWRFIIVAKFAQTQQTSDAEILPRVRLS